MSTTYDTAYSLESKPPLNLDAKIAHDLSVKHQLTNRHAFQCSDTCHFQLTLTNFAKKNYIQTPHYRSSHLDQRHDSCKLIQNRKEERIGTTDNTHTSYQRKDSELIIDIDLVNGSLVQLTNAQTLIKEQVKTPNKKSRSHPSPYSLSNLNREIVEHIKSLRKIIEYYIDTQQGELYTFKDKNGNKLNLKEHFIKLYPGIELPYNKVNIYFGDAKIFLNEGPYGNYFTLKFLDECSIEKILLRPSVNINFNNSNHHGVGSKFKQLERLSKSKSKCLVFFLGQFVINESNGNFYLNLLGDSKSILDYLVIYDT